jgi:hypothetical protein
MTVKQLNIKIHKYSSNVYAPFLQKLDWDFISLFSSFYTKERANRNRNCKCVKPYIKISDAFKPKDSELDERGQKKRLSILFSLFL